MNSEENADLTATNSEAFSQRLEQALDGEKPTAFAKRSGITVSAFMKYFKGTQPGLDTAVKIAEHTNVRLEWLATGQGAMRPEGFDSLRETSHGEGTQPEQKGVPMLQIARPDNLVEGAMVLVPRLSVQASAGAGALVESEQIDDFVAFAASYLRSLDLNPSFARIHKVKGDSMSPTLSDGEWVIVDTSIDHVEDEGLYSVVYGGLLLVKRIQLRRDGGLTLVSDNKSDGYTDEIVKPDDLYDLKIAGRVRGHFRFT